MIVLSRDSDNGFIMKLPIDLIVALGHSISSSFAEGGNVV